MEDFYYKTSKTFGKLISKKAKTQVFQKFQNHEYCKEHAKKSLGYVKHPSNCPQLNAYFLKVYLFIIFFFLTAHIFPILSQVSLNDSISVDFYKTTPDVRNSICSRSVMGDENVLNILKFPQEKQSFVSLIAKFNDDVLFPEKNQVNTKVVQPCFEFRTFDYQTFASFSRHNAHIQILFVCKPSPLEGVSRQTLVFGFHCAYRAVGARKEQIQYIGRFMSPQKGYVTVF